ncbi:CSMD3 [Symbiodinium sp. CCMP2456]|nr:CSMD3 [Symbiodinium sp. CCMP2456]
MATVVFAHFGASAVALILRSQTRPALRCAARCYLGISRCLCCGRREESDSPVTQRRRCAGIKWYWFHLAIQVAFAMREALVVSALSWNWELLFVHSATWLTLAIVTREVWLFSGVREGSEKRKVAVDGLLDMLLLPVNIIFFCAVCIRVLKLQPDTQMGKMVPVIIESGDIYEAFALWSVLVLFVKVVQAEMAGDSHSNAMSSFRSFKAISLQGVKAWVFIQSAAVLLKLALQGVVAVYVPTFCYWASKSCTSCEQLYEENIAIALSAVTFLLCSFAIMFVFYFESGYRHHLEKTEPLWKFLGVKGIVSVTYFQWLVISVLASPLKWTGNQVYLFHCLLYAFWMPLLAVVHTFLAYPFYSFRSSESSDLAPWLIAWLKTLGVGEDLPSSSTPSLPSISGTIDSRSEVLLDGSCEVRSMSRVSSELLSHPASSKCQLLVYFTVGLLSCVASSKALLTLLPAEATPFEAPLRNISCAGQGDLAHFLLTRQDLHFALLNDTAERWSSPGVAGAWLPLCSATAVGCAPGHFADRLAPSVGCSAKGIYTYTGSCSAISCGAPPHLPHAVPRMHDIERQNWTYGVTIHYDCDKPGYRGDLSAECNLTGTWVVHGSCVEVTCGLPPEDVPHAHAVLDPSHSNISTGMVVRYQCDEMYNGTPTATCGDDGMYVKAGRCRRECGAPPAISHAAPRFNNSGILGGWFEGMQCPYSCDPGFHGFASAVCMEDGGYNVSGRCAPVSCGQPPRLPEATARMDDMKAAASRNFTFGVHVRYACNRPMFHGELVAKCNSTSLWVISGQCTQVTCGDAPAVPHAKPVATEDNMTAGSVLRYQCDDSYNGTPTAACGFDGQFVVSGRCRRQCGVPPSVRHAVPSFNHDALAAGWLSGMGASYRCDPGFDGAVTAMCGDDGNFSIEGLCKVASAVETNRLRSSITGLSTAIGVENALILAGLGFFGWQRYRISTRNVANPANEMSSPICPDAERPAASD